MNTLQKFQYFLKYFGWFKIPMIGFINPSIVLLNDTTVQVKIKLKRRTKNHLNSMYFGSLAVGADLTAGIHAFHFGNVFKRKVSFAFKSIQADFIKRAESDVTFETNDGQKIEEAVRRSVNEKKRINQEVLVTAKNKKQETVATFIMTSSIKVIQ
jgi:hypothetical protein